MATLETQYNNWLKGKIKPITYLEWLGKFSEIHNLDKFKMKDLLIKLGACQEAKDWAADKDWKEIYQTCHRGDWLLWLFQKTNPNDLQLLTLAKGHCANTLRDLMKDERSIKAVDVAIAFGEGKASREELDSAAAYAAYAANAAYAYASAAYASAAYAAADASYVASSAAAYAATAHAYASAAYASAAYAASYAASSAAAYAATAHAASARASYAAADASYAASSAARKENLQLTADLCRKYLPIEVWNI